MEEFLEKNYVWLIIVCGLVFVFLLGLILSSIIRHNQTKKDKTKKIERNNDFQEYVVKNIKVEDVDISSLKDDNDSNNNDSTNPTY